MKRLQSHAGITLHGIFSDWRETAFVAKSRCVERDREKSKKARRRSPSATKRTFFDFDKGAADATRLKPKWVSRQPLFTSASILLPVINETECLITTIDILEQTCASDIGQYILIVCDKTKPDSLRICEIYSRRDDKRFVLLRQTLPYLGGALRDAFQIIRGTHVVMMASDLETDPASVQELIRRAKAKPKAIITATRWRAGGSFNGYHPAKLLANWLFQKMFSLLYWTHLSDMTFGFRIFPSDLVQSIVWQELRHPFLFESILKPIRMGVETEEIPSTWQSRSEGESLASVWLPFAYFRVGLKLRFLPVKAFLKRRNHPEFEFQECFK